MSLHRTFAITRRLLQQFRHDRRTLALLLVTPVVMLGLFSLLFSGEMQPASLAIVNLDAGPVGAAITSGLRGSEQIDLHEMTQGAAEAALEAAEIDGYLVLPRDLTQQALAGEALQPELRLRGTDQAAAARIGAALGQALPGALISLIPAGTFTLPTLDLQTSYLYGRADLGTLDLLGGPFIGLVVFFLVYVVTSISFLRERSLGTLERLLASPLRRSEIVLGYMLGFTAVALVQAAEVLAFSIWLLGLYNAGSLWLVFGIEVLLALAAINLGIFLSTFARSEFQAVQFIPLVVAPQILLSGLIVPVSAEPGWLQVVSNALPLTYAVDALRAVMLEGQSLASSQVLLDTAVLAAFVVVVLAAAGATLRRTVA
jgi:ABC-2 type transport system permease protein